MKSYQTKEQLLYFLSWKFIVSKDDQQQQSFCHHQKKDLWPLQQHCWLPLLIPHFFSTIKNYFVKKGKNVNTFTWQGEGIYSPPKMVLTLPLPTQLKCKSSSGPPFYQDKMFYSPFCSFFNFLGLLQRKGPVLLRVANNSEPAVITSHFCVVTNELFLYCLVNN